MTRTLVSTTLCVLVRVRMCVINVSNIEPRDCVMCLFFDAADKRKTGHDDSAI